MEIKNNKDDIPFEHYYAQYCQIDPNEAAARCGFEFDGSNFRFSFMGIPASFSFPEGELTVGSEMPIITAKEYTGARLLMIRYILSGRITPASGAFLAYRDMPWGDVYDRNFNGRCILRLAYGFGHNTAGFVRAMERFGAKRAETGDVSYEIEFLPGLSMRFIIWEADEEFPPSSQILFSDNFPAAFTAEDMAVIGDVTIGALKNLSKEVL